MRGIGLREWVALGVLAVAGFLGFMFFDPSSTDGSNKTIPERTPTAGAGDALTEHSTPGTTVTSVASPQPTPTPVPVARLGEPGGQWLVQYYESSSPGQGVRSGEGFVQNLEFDVPGRPFPDFKDDSWRLVASQGMELSAGRYGFVLECDGALTVKAGDSILIDVEDSPQRQTRAVEFDHKGGRLQLSIEVRDTGGPVFLRWGR